MREVDGPFFAHLTGSGAAWGLHFFPGATRPAFCGSAGAPRPASIRRRRGPPARHLVCSPCMAGYEARQRSGPFVYVVLEGRSFHARNCHQARTFGNKPHRIPHEQALARGLAPCTTCAGGRP